ncbi:arsenate reductase (glutaredoxin) [Pontibacter sp. 172403-2]|uniref:arsenate reductase (glutaredoxin) n=1 Tax=Pontibacter rufus TaxID=2791028 RepID=UPI0018B00FA4|nr:arsenate reductase (glutaredoxin) [Pontibacter sp. 172403-2]MBF9254540.1 arsenate reductase (glutaredoxin) [Pontibacter sp. 172403-2]
MIQLYHNNRCSKSRQALELLQDEGQEVQVIEYLKQAPTAGELERIVQKLGIKPEQLLRKGESVYKTQFAGQTHTDEEWIRIMAEHPVLIERPIIVNGNKAVIGRPPEKVLTIL